MMHTLGHSITHNIQCSDTITQWVGTWGYDGKISLVLPNKPSMGSYNDTPFTFNNDEALKLAQWTSELLYIWNQLQELIILFPLYILTKIQQALKLLDVPWCQYKKHVRTCPPRRLTWRERQLFVDHAGQWRWWCVQRVEPVQKAHPPHTPLLSDQMAFTTIQTVGLIKLLHPVSTTSYQTVSLSTELSNYKQRSHRYRPLPLILIT